MIAPLVQAKTMATAVVAALVLGIAAGAGLARWHYAPRLESCELRAKTLGQHVDDQNKAIGDLKDAEQRRKAEADQAVAEATSRAEAAQAEAQRLLSEDRPAGVDECAAARALITRELAR